MKEELNLIGTYYISKLEGIPDNPEKMEHLVDRNDVAEELLEAEYEF